MKDRILLGSDPLPSLFLLRREPVETTLAGFVEIARGLESHAKA